MLKVAPAAFLAVLLGSCASNRLDHIDRAVRGSHIRVVLVEKKFSLYSTFEQQFSAKEAQLIQEEIARLERLFGFEVSEPFRILLKPVEAPSLDDAVRALEESGDLGALLESLSPADSRGVTGMCYGTQMIEIIVGRNEETAIVAKRARTKSLRHELAHGFVFQATSDGSLWKQEGIAEAIEGSTISNDEKLHLNGSAQCLLEARLATAAIPAHELLNWCRLERLDRESSMRALANSHILYLLEKNQHVADAQFLSSIYTLSRAEAQKTLTSTYAWLQSLDFGEWWRSAAKSSTSEEERNQLLETLTSWMSLDADSVRSGMTSQLGSLASDTTDQIIVEWLLDPKTACEASNYLIRNRGTALSKETIARIRESDQAGPRLTLMALSARSGQEIDRAVAIKLSKELFSLDRSWEASAAFRALRQRKILE